MKNYLHIILLLLIVLSSCTSVKKVSKHLNEKQHSLAYLHDSPQRSKLSEESIKINSVTLAPGVIPDSAQVSRQSTVFVPLIFFYYWDSKKLCVQGRNMIQEDISDFVQKSIETEVDRSGIIHLDSLNSSRYTLDISIDNSKTWGVYVVQGFSVYIFFGTLTSSVEKAGPSISQITMTYSLKEDGIEILRDTVSANRGSSSDLVKRGTRKKLIHDFGANMAEAMSQNIKFLSKQVVNEVNDYFEKNQKM